MIVLQSQTPRCGESELPVVYGCIFLKTAGILINIGCRFPGALLKNFLGNADVSRVLSGYTFTSQNGIKLTGTYKYGVQVTSMTVTSDASTTPFYEGDGTTTVNYNWFYIPLSSIGNHMLCGLRYNKHGVSSGGGNMPWLIPGMIVSLINTGILLI